MNYQAAMQEPARLVLADGTEFAVHVTEINVQHDVVDVTTFNDATRQFRQGLQVIEFSARAIGTGRKVVMEPLPAAIGRAISLTAEMV